MNVRVQVGPSGQVVAVRDRQCPSLACFYPTNSGDQWVCGRREMVGCPAGETTRVDFYRKGDDGVWKPRRPR